MKADVIVVGGGHAGARPRPRRPDSEPIRFSLTHRFATIGEMSCNPAIGGLGKGHLVREIDALDGLMGRVADRAGIQFRVLNRRKGPAVRGPRAQADRALYRAAMQAAIARLREPARRRRRGRRPRRRGRPRRRRACSRDGRRIAARRGRAHDRHVPARPDPSRRANDAGRPASARRRASACRRRLRAPGFALGRLKTGTPPRLDGRTIDWASLERQPGDEPPEPFSALTDAITTPQVDCHITRTTAETHDDHPRESASLGDVFRPDREPRAALLPLDRGQDRPLRRPREPPDFPGAGGARRPHDLPERHLDLAARGRAGSRSSARCPGWSGPRSCAPATPSNTTMSTRASSRRRSSA